MFDHHETPKIRVQTPKNLWVANTYRDIINSNIKALLTGTPAKSTIWFALFGPPARNGVLQWSLQLGPTSWSHNLLLSFFFFFCCCCCSCSCSPTPQFGGNTCTFKMSQKLIFPKLLGKKTKTSTKFLEHRLGRTSRCAQDAVMADSLDRLTSIYSKILSFACSVVGKNNKHSTNSVCSAISNGRISKKSPAINKQKHPQALWT